MPSDDAEVDALRPVYRAACERVDDAPDARVRAAVLAAAARRVDARPQAVPEAGRSTSRSGTAPRSRRWPLSAAALLVVSVMTGLVATRVLRDRPEAVTTVASAPRPADGDAPGTARQPAALSPPPIGTPSYDRPSTVAAAAPRVEGRVAAARPREAEGATTGPRKAETIPVRPERIAEPRRSPMRDQEQAASVVAPPAPRASANRTEAPRPKIEAPSAVAEVVTDPAPRVAAAPDVRALATARPAPVSDAARSRIGRVAEPATPEAWVERIVRLRATGDDVEADREVEALHARYPDFAIPSAAVGGPRTR